MGGLTGGPMICTLAYCTSVCSPISRTPVGKPGPISCQCGRLADVRLPVRDGGILPF
jgi:hypothetical protein